MFDLKNVTFLIPYRYDSPDRLRNLNACVSYLNANLDTNIIIMEEAPERTFFNEGKFVYQFNKNPDPLLHRTRMLNDMCKMARTPIIALMDTDVFLIPSQMWDAQQLIRSNQFDMVYPYDGRFNNYVEPQLAQIISTNSLDGLTAENGHQIHHNSLGGCIMFNKEKFIEGGMENQNHMSWGWEDNCRVHRFSKLGYRINRIPGIIYHLNHASSTNSANTSHDAYHNNQREFMKVANMSKDQLLQYVSTWPWNK